jgi:hypothetical protein
VQIIATLTSGAAAVVPPPQTIAPTGAAIPAAINEVASMQAELARASARLSPTLDDTWRRYLALPAEVFDPGRRPTPEAIEAALARFNTVAQNPQYQALASRPEFRDVQQLLQRLASNLRINRAQPLSLPPPPTTR